MAINKWAWQCPTRFYSQKQVVDQSQSVVLVCQTLFSDDDLETHSRVGMYAAAYSKIKVTNSTQKIGECQT